LKLRARGHAALTRGAAADAFIRPEAMTLARTPAELPQGQSALNGEVTDMLFDGANSVVLLREEHSRRELRIALPQTGAFADLKPGARISFGFDPERAICFPASAHHP
jgi:spermidine/putrescine transport system ATP-binding protein